MKKAINILIIDDDEFVTASLTDYLINKGFSVTTANNGKNGLKVFERKHPPLVLLDQNLPDMEGVEVCRKILDIDPNAKIIFITAYATIEYAVRGMQAGAFNYLSKPFELEELLIAIDMAMKNVHMEGRLRVQDYKREKERQEKKLVGSSEVLDRIREQIVLAASTDATVLITGETGVGKNVVAKAIHDLQDSRTSFLSINCSAIPENLIEAEYFGHEKGSFTGATSRREGIFELSDGGTLLLDEIGEIPLHLQSKLLTVLEEKNIRRIGSSRNIPVDVRIIATTNLELEEAIKNKTFRQDLYYRLGVFTMHIPPLRQHPEDISEIIDFFLKQFLNYPVKVPDSHIRKLMKYQWPGNVRELRNIIERACLILQGNELKPADLLFQKEILPQMTPSKQNFDDIQEIMTLDQAKEQHIISALKTCSGNKSQTAKALGISLSTLKRKLKDLGYQ